MSSIAVFNNSLCNIDLNNIYKHLYFGKSMKFVHMGDCHLGSWRYPELQELNMASFRKAIDFSVKEQVDFVLMAGDIFDSAYPSIDILKQSFKEFKKLYDAKIPCFIIAGSHDYSVSGKTFLDVLEHAGFCKNTHKYEIREDKIVLQPTIFEKCAIYGYPGMKSGLEVVGLKKSVLQDAPGFFKIFMLHTALTEAIGNVPIESVSLKELPKANYYALGHLHVDFGRQDAAYSGPTFPNNFEELEELEYGRFQFIQFENDILKRETIPIKIKEILKLEVTVDNSLTATEKILAELNKYPLEDKIILLRVSGTFPNGKISDIRFKEIEQFVSEKKPYVFIKNTSKLKVEDNKIYYDSNDMEKVEDTIIKEHSKNNSKFSAKIPTLLQAFSMEKQEDERNQIFEDRLLSELKNILEF